MDPSDSTLAQVIASTRARLRERTLPALTTALVLQISIASARRGYDLRALSSAFGLVVLIVLALVGATFDALLTLAATVLRDVTRVRVRFGPAAPVVVTPAPPITEEMLLDKRGRPLRGAPRAKRIALIERERATVAAVATAAAKPAFRVIELPPLPPRLVAAYASARALLVTASRAADRVRARVPTVPVPTLPLRWVRIVAVTTTMTFVFATAIGTTGVIAQQGRIALGASTTLSIISGDVTARTSDSADFRSVSDGELLRAGMTIRTSDNSYAVLTYFEGSTVSIEPNTTLVIETLESHPDGSSAISMRQQVGRTWHSVTKLLNPGSKYEVKTPTLTAAVRGTAFEVGVARDGTTGEVVSSVITTEGAVGASKPPTPAEPAPPEVIVPAGFQATAKAADPIAPPEPAPEPERKVTVTVGTSNAVVVDPLGRANGEKDGKLVLQTPGAKVTKVDGKLVITLPNVADGRISTVIAAAAQQAARGPVSVETLVSERGRGDARSEESVQAPASAGAPAVITGVELKRSDSGQPAEVRVLNASETRQTKAPKLAGPPKRPEPPKPELLPAPEQKDEAGKSESRAGAKVSGVVDVFVKSTLPPLSVEDAGKRADEARKVEERAKEEAEKRDEQRRKENGQRAEDARRAEEKAKEEAARLGDERRKAEERAKEEVAKAGSARRTEQTARGTAPAQPEPAKDAPAALGPASIVETIVKAIVPSGADEAVKKADELRKSEDKAKDEAAKAGDERRKAEETKRQGDIKKAEGDKKAAEQKGEELKKAEEKAKQDGAKDLERVREIEAKAREQSQKLDSEKRKEAERLIEEFRKSEEKAREESTKRLEEQRKAEDNAKQDAERKLDELRTAQEKAKEEAAKANEDRKRDEQRKSEEKAKEEKRTSNFVPALKIDQLPGTLGSNRSGRGNSGR